MTTTDPLAIERYKTAYAEYRAEVALGWDRQKLFLTLPAGLTALVSSIGSHRVAAQIALVASALVALAGALIVRRSHGRYRAARATLLAIETELGVQDLQTTGGQREARGGLRLERFRVVDVLVGVFCLIAALDVALALMW
jgi:hypothetical protein